MSDIRCIHKGRNKVGYFSPHLVNNDFWRKQTGWEPAPLPTLEMPHEESGEMPIMNPDDLHTKVSGKTILATGKPKAKRKYTKKNQQPA